MCYSAITGYLGFEVNEGEYKVMGLAPYGQPKYLKQIGQLIEAGPGGEYRSNLKYYSFLQEEILLVPTIRQNVFLASLRIAGRPVAPLRIGD
jgi:carbamoyltransferase